MSKTTIYVTKEGYKQYLDTLAEYRKEHAALLKTRSEYGKNETENYQTGVYDTEEALIISSINNLVETIKSLDGLIDIYLPDFKYFSPDLSRDYSAAPDYAEVATEAVLEMFRQTGKYEEADGLTQKGVILRHLVLPGCRADSIAVLGHIASILPVADIRVSVMRQYTPDFAMDCPHKNLHRRVTEFEYDSVLTNADELGIVGYRQGKDAAQRAYTPDFGKL